ncbi:hypothetical protein, partial [Pseudomonas putida]|uniref:hypothetical protein n=1 Tax=Pseudomonas putida TaxID=303 RepID=UPI001E2A07DB
MINLTREVIITQSGKELESSIKKAITKSKKCICEGIFKTSYIPLSKITSSARNQYSAASIVRLFDNHLSPENSPSYDEKWVQNAYLCTLKTPELKIAKAVAVKSSHDWLNKSSLEKLNRACLLIFHFLWQEKAVLLPICMKKPVVGDPATGTNFFEIAATSYTEVLALVRQPFVEHVSYESIPDITTVMHPAAISNFDWYAWRLIRCTDWHRIEDIDPAEISALTTHIALARKGKVDWPQYPMAPAALWGYVQRLYPDRCQKVDFEAPIKNAIQANKRALISGEFAYPAKYKDVVEIWLKHQNKFVEILKSRGMKSFDDYAKCFAILNTYLFSDFPILTGLLPPIPKDFTRRHIEGDGFRGLISYINQGRSKPTVKGTLYKISALFDYLSANSNIDNDLTGFVNPISHIDFPIIKKHSSSTKPAFSSEHFPYLLQYCYAVESFGSYIFDKVLEENINLYDERYRSDINTKNWTDAHKVMQTDKYGYVPIVFYRNPLFDISQPKSRTNSPVSYDALHLLPRILLPLV